MKCATYPQLRLAERACCASSACSHWNRQVSIAVRQTMMYWSDFASSYYGKWYPKSETQTHFLFSSCFWANRSRLAQDPLLYHELVTSSFVSNIRLLLSLSCASSFGDYLLDLSICATHACADLVKRKCFEWGLSQWLQFSERPSSSCGDLFNMATDSLRWSLCWYLLHLVCFCLLR